jgi:hypothetical protein
MSVNMESWGKGGAVTALPARDELLIPKIAKLLIVRIMEGKLPNAGDPDVVSIWSTEKLERSNVQPPVWDLVCR